MSFTFLLIGSVPKSHLEKAEKEINKKIEKELQCNNNHFYKELEKYFESYLIKNKLLKKGENVGNGYYNYLKTWINNGGLDKVRNSQENRRLKEELQCAGYNLSRKKNEMFLYNCFNPVILKYKSELIKEKKEKELSYRIGTIDPRKSGTASFTTIANGLLEQYRPIDFERPVLKKFVLLFFFVQLQM